MFCKNCAKEIPDQAAVCVGCGTPVNTGFNFCANCGGPLNPGAAVCTNCGAPTVVVEAKSKMIAGILGILVGGLGIHNFYLGYITKGVIQVVLTALGVITCGLLFPLPIAAGIWGLVEGIMILTGNINKDAKGIPLKD